MLQKQLRAISENLSVYADMEIRNDFLQCAVKGCEHQHIMEIRVENEDEEAVLGGYYCKEHFLELLRRELPRINLEDEIELAGLFALNVIDVLIDRSGLEAMEKILAAAEAKPIEPPADFTEEAPEDDSNADAA
ncbi:MAG: hypothetical protein E3J72_19615 [Planctomycetota bacterium]|nr:MAG: hypothetical protein E3J72_19615 [Planctomycetota bacterium]